MVTPRLARLFLLAFGVLGCTRHDLPSRALPPAKAPAAFFTPALRASIEARLAGVRAHADVDGGRSPVGAMVVGVYGRGESAFFIQDADPNTVFEVCSVTKALTGVLLADAVVRHRMRLEDEAQSHVRQLTLPTDPGGPIRVGHLATYSAGFPWQPTNFVSKREGGYTRDAWASFVQGFNLPYAPGTGFEYGNVGFAVLGDLLAEDAGMPIDALFRQSLFSTPTSRASRRRARSRRRGTICWRSFERTSRTGRCGPR
jgi:CubicO group peptidase (beta-lactamase class C family)